MKRPALAAALLLLAAASVAAVPHEASAQTPVLEFSATSGAIKEKPPWMSGGPNSDGAVTAIVLSTNGVEIPDAAAVKFSFSGTAEHHAHESKPHPTRMYPADPDVDVVWYPSYELVAKDRNKPAVTLTKPANGLLTYSMAVVPDARAEGDETLVVRIMPGTGYSVGERDTFTLTVRDGPARNLARVSVADASQGENVTVTVTLDHPQRHSKYFVVAVANCDGSNPAPDAATRVKYSLSASQYCGSDPRASVADDLVLPTWTAGGDTLYRVVKFLKVPAGQTAGSVDWPTVSDSEQRTESFLIEVAPSGRYHHHSDAWLHRDSKPGHDGNPGYNSLNGYVFWKAKIDHRSPSTDTGQVRLPEHPLLTKMANLTVAGVGNDTVTVSWTQLEHAEKYDVRWWETSEGVETRSHRALVAGEYEISGLRPGTEYSVYVVPLADHAWYERYATDVLTVRTLPDIDPLSDGTQQAPLADSAVDGGRQGESQPPSDHPLVKHASLISDIKTEYILDHDDDTKHTKWKRVLKAMGDPDYLNYPRDKMTSQEAAELYADNGWQRWEPVSGAIGYAESYYGAQQQKEDQQPQQQQQEQQQDQQEEEDQQQPPSDHPLVKYASLISDIKDTYIADHGDDTKHTKWKRVLKAMGDPDYADYPRDAMTSERAAELYDTNGWDRWAPVADAIGYAESYYAR